MRIVFNLQGVGLGNNGGSRTLIKCAETLQNLGEEVIISTATNKYTWSEINVDINNALLTCDVLMSTGYASAKFATNWKADKKFYYIRGYETWNASDVELFESYKSSECIVNSEWLRFYLKSNGIHSTLIYPGLDFEDFFPQKIERENIIGGLYNKRHKTKRHQEVEAICEKLGNKYQLRMLNRDLKDANSNQLREFYNSIKVWISPSELEGLHNCPMEASLCGCVIVGTNHPRGGISDYANQDTAKIYQARNTSQAAEQVDELMNDSDLRKQLNDNMNNLLHTKIGDRKNNMTRMLKLFKGENLD